jgi:hypothetical protein
MVAMEKGRRVSLGTLLSPRTAREIAVGSVFPSRLLALHEAAFLI